MLIEMKMLLTKIEKDTLRRIAVGAPLRETLDELLCQLEYVVSGLRIAVLMVDQDTEGNAAPRLRFGSAPSMGDGYKATVDRTNLLPGNTPSADVVLYGNSVFIEDGETDPRCSATVRTVYAQFDIRACYLVPLRDANATTVSGVLCFYPDHIGLPTPAEAKLLALGADLCALALTRANAENARLRSEATVGHLLSGLRHQAMTDPLTGLPNRAYLLQVLQQSLDSCAPSPTKSGSVIVSHLAIIFVDLDRFKQVNDTFGHRMGDRLLVEMGRRFTQAIPPGDLVARLGGDEFVILLHYADAKMAMQTACEIQRLSAKSVVHDGKEAFVNSSIGIALWLPGDRLTAESFLNNADIAMYQAKKEGGNGCALFTQTMGDQALSAATLESDLHRALVNQELRLVFQPQFDSITGRMIGAEALVRWHHPQHGLVPPGDFIPIAEASGLIEPLGEWILMEACRYGAYWQRFARPLRLAVNLSARQFAPRNRLAEQIENVLMQTGFDPHLLDLEITESVVLTKNAPVSETLAAIKRLGVRLLLDDFGTGYGSLLYLRHFPLDVIKIDRSFVGGLSKTREDMAIVRAVIDLAHALRMRVIAEGVETDDQRAELSLLGCDALQGYLLSRPLDPAGILQRLQDKE